MPVPAYFNTSPVEGGSALPISVPPIGGVIYDFVGLNGVRLSASIAANDLPTFTSANNSFQVLNSTTISARSLSALGGGISELGVRITISDGDTASGNIWVNSSFLSFNSVAQVVDLSQTQTYSHNSLGDVGANAIQTGYPNDNLATGWSLITDSAKLSAIYASLVSTGGVLDLKWQQTGSGGNFLDFTSGIDASLLSFPTVSANVYPSVDLIAASDTGASNTDNNTTDDTPTLNGTAAPSDLLQIFDGATLLGTTTADVNGDWSFTPSTSLPGKTYSITVKAVDGSNNVLASSGVLAITVVVPPAAPSASQLNPVTDSGVSNGDNLTNDATPSFEGTNQPGNTVELFAGAVSLGRALVDSAGKWSLTPTTVLADGTYQITLKAISPSGLVSASSPAVPLTIDTRPATAVILEIDQPVRDSGANTLTLKFSETVRNVDPSDLALSLNGQPIPLVGATLTTTDNLSWTLGNIPGLTQASGDYQISLKPGNDITDSAGNALATGNTESWLTGYTSDAMPSFGFKDGKKGLKVRDGGNGTVLWGKGGRDTLNGAGGNDRLSGRGGSDKLKGGAGKDRMGGGGGNDRLFGGGGKDRLKGKKGQDRLLGGASNDRLIGGGNDDVLVGGKGKDLLTGNNGKDSFTFNNLKEAGDRVTDFDSANDLIDVRGIFKSPQFGGDNRFAQYHQFMQLVQVGSNTEVRIDTDGKGAGTAFTTLVTLQNVLVSGVKSTNFVVG